MVSVFIAVITPLALNYFKHDIDIYFMGFFRDLARLKARRRRMDNGKAMSIVSSKKDFKMLFFKLEEEDPLQSIIDEKSGDSSEELKYIHDLPIYTREELFEHGNGENEETRKILLSLYGRVYDVSAGEKFYGAGGPYHSFAGRDVTHALSTGCLIDSCLGSVTSSEQQQTFNFTETESSEGKKWLAFFETHDSYSHVGMLNDGSEKTIEQLLDGLVEMEVVATNNI